LDYERALELQRSLMPAVQGRALTGVQLGAYASAREDFSRLLEANPADELARVGRAFCAVNEGDLDVALDDCDAALRRRPNAPRALGIRAFVRALRGDHRGAISDGDAALRGTARAPTARAARALAKALAGDTQGAVQDLQPLGANASFDTLALSCQAYVLVVAGRSAEGLSLSERALKLNSRFELAREACARAHLQLGDHEQAIRECTWVLADMSADYPTRRRVERLLEEARAR
jgi:tetratricopeptide (TPR) repeat protein